LTQASREVAIFHDGMLPFMLAEFAVMFLRVLFPSLVIVPMRWLTS